MATDEKNSQQTQVAVQRPVDNPFGNTQAVVAPGTASAAAMVRRELGEVQAGVWAAKEDPRDQVKAMERILTSCGRVTLAQEALYQYARGGTDIEGPSIRLVEEIARQWRNVWSGVIEVDRRGSVSEMLAYAWDLESNFRDEKRFQVKHWRDTKQGGYMVHDERDIYEIVANQGARRKRACILAVIPGDVVDAAVEQCKQTLKTKVEITPERIAALVKSFADEFGVSKEQIEKRLQRRVDSITPAQVVQLRKVYNSLRDGMSAPLEWFEAVQTAGGEPAPVVDQKGVEGAKAALKARRAAEPPAGPPNEQVSKGGETRELPISDADAKPPT